MQTHTIRVTDTFTSPFIPEPLHHHPPLPNQPPQKASLPSVDCHVVSAASWIPLGNEGVQGKGYLYPRLPRINHDLLPQTSQLRIKTESVNWPLSEWKWSKCGNVCEGWTAVVSLCRFGMTCIHMIKDNKCCLINVFPSRVQVYITALKCSSGSDAEPLWLVGGTVKQKLYIYRDKGARDKSCQVL